MPSGDTVTNCSIATTERWKDAAGQDQEHTEWHRIVFFGKLGDIAVQYLNKGSKIYTEGKIRSKKWQDKNGVHRYSTEIIADKLLMMGSRAAVEDEPAYDDPF